MEIFAHFPRLLSKLPNQPFFIYFVCTLKWKYLPIFHVFSPLGLVFPLRRLSSQVWDKVTAGAEIIHRHIQANTARYGQKNDVIKEHCPRQLVLGCLWQ